MLSPHSFVLSREGLDTESTLICFITWRTRHWLHNPELKPMRGRGSGNCLIGDMNWIQRLQHFCMTLLDVSLVSFVLFVSLTICWVFCHKFQTIAVGGVADVSMWLCPCEFSETWLNTMMIDKFLKELYVCFMSCMVFWMIPFSVRVWPAWLRLCVVFWMIPCSVRVWPAWLTGCKK